MKLKIRLNLFSKNKVKNEVRRIFVFIIGGSGGRGESWRRKLRWW